MLKNNFIYHTGESCLKTGDYELLSCTGVLCIGASKKVINFTYGERFPKCFRCGQTAEWTCTETNHFHQHESRIHFNTRLERQAG